MTIRGNGVSLIDYDISPELQQHAPILLEQVEKIVDTLFVQLQSNEVDFDTSAGTIEFPYSNRGRDLLGKTTWTRIFQDWVFIRLRQMVVSDEVLQAHTLVINGLHQKTKKHLES